MLLPHLTVVIAALLASAIATAGAQTTYRWTDKATGQTVFSDQAAPPGARGVAAKESRPPAGESRLPYATLVAAEKFPVTLYTAANCAEACADARRLLNGRGVPFAETMVKNQDEAAELARELGGEAGFPAIRVGRQSFVGFAASSWNSLLDLAGYPKSAPYGSKPSGAFAQ